MRFSRAYIFCLTVLLVSCNTTPAKFPQAATEPEERIDVVVHRFDEALFSLDQENFQEGLLTLQEVYSPLLSADLTDTSNVRQLLDFVQDTQIIALHEKTMEVFPQVDLLETDLSDAFSRYHMYFPEQTLPEVYTYISDMHFEMPIILIGDEVLIASIDLYLGQDFPRYMLLGLPFYKVRWMKPASLPVDIMKALYFNNEAPVYKPRTLLDRMVDGGKLLAYLDAVQPDVPDEYKISYTSEQLKWVYENEKNIWAFLISNDLLYSTDYQTITKLIQDGPFTTGFSNESPSRLGVYIGWQIVTEYLRHNPGVSLKEMIRNTDSQDILQNSGYKP